jgi:hypothetical protein
MTLRRKAAILVAVIATLSVLTLSWLAPVSVPAASRLCPVTASQPAT